jgi:multicomponent Na+:H+ antiporter subunit D
MTQEQLVTLAVVLPALATLPISLAGRWPNLREAISLTTAVVTAMVVLSLVPDVLAGARPQTATFSIFVDLKLGFAIEPLGMLFACVASILWIVNTIYSIGYMRGNNEPRQTSFYVCFAVAISSAIGIAFSANLLTLFLFYEILTLSTYPLVTHKGDDAAKSGGRVYLLLLLGTSMVLLLPAIIATLVLAGTLDFTPGGILAGTASGLTLALLFGAYMFGIGKAALMPLHFWLPAAMVAPTPVSALLHAVAVVKAGVFTVVKVVVYIFGIDFLAQSGAADWLLYAAGFTVLVASLVALRQDNLKRRLAYSTVSQLSYVILATAILTPISIVGAVLHIAAHAVSKITLFFAAGSIYTATHLTEVSQLRGIGRRMPWTMTAFAIGALSMIGVPPTAGFLGKWFMLTGAMDSANWIALGVIVISTLLNAAYFLPIVFNAFFLSPDKSNPGDHHHGEAPWPIVLALTATAIGTFAMFFFPEIPMELAKGVISSEGVD